MRARQKSLLLGTVLLCFFIIGSTIYVRIRTNLFPGGNSLSMGVFASSDMRSIRQFLFAHVDMDESDIGLDARSCWNCASSSKQFVVSELDSKREESLYGAMVLNPTDDRVLLAVAELRDLEGSDALQILDPGGQARIFARSHLIHAGFTQICRPINAGCHRTLGASKYSIIGEIQGLGLVEPNTEIVRRFSIANRGDAALYVESLHSSCGCVSVESVGRVVVPPRMEHHFDVKVKAGAKGDFRQTVRLSMTDAFGIAKEAQILFVGNVIPFLMLSPEALDFGYVSTHDSRTNIRRLCLSETLTNRFEILSVACSTPGLLPTVVGRETRDGVGVYLIEISLRPAEFTIGRHNEALVVSTNSTLTPEVRVPIRFSVESRRVRIIPDRIRLPHLHPYSTSIVVRGNTQDEVSVNVQRAPKDSVVTVEKLGSSTIRIKLAFSGSSLPTEVDQLVLSVSTGDDVEVHTIDVSGEEK